MTEPKIQWAGRGHIRRENADKAPLKITEEDIAKGFQNRGTLLDFVGEDAYYGREEDYVGGISPRPKKKE